jgi:dihydrofolate synthase/folylpolyglutamate synthase
MAETLAQKLERLKGLHPKEIDLSLERAARLMAALGDPQDRLPPAVHVAGTNGKGSVIAFLRAILEAAGYLVHVYTSPHLVRFEERIRLAGKLIPEAELLSLLDECEAANRGQPITFFEITTAAAFLAFAGHEADIVLLETGLGGRLDATNLIKRPALTVLTPVDLDHQAYLGETLAAIAAEKAGIFKPGVGCVSAKQGRAAVKVIEARSLQLGVPIWSEGKEWFLRAAHEGLIYESALGRRGPFPKLGLIGPHQLHNAAQAIACAERLEGFAINDEAIAKGLAQVDWPARLQRLAQGKLAELLPEGWELWLDGGHNPAAGEALARQARLWRDKPLHMIFAMMADKDAGGFLKPLAARFHEFYAVAVPGESRSLSAEDAAQAARAQGALQAKTAANIESALQAIAASGGPPGRVILAGSLYLAGAALKANGG